jgi:hypothetical protein
MILSCELRPKKGLCTPAPNFLHSSLPNASLQSLCGDYFHQQSQTLLSGFFAVDSDTSLTLFFRIQGDEVDSRGKKHILFNTIYLTIFKCE